MTTITAPLRRFPRTVRTPSTSMPTRARRAMARFHRVTEGMNSDHRATLCDLTLRPYTEARTLR